MVTAVLVETNVFALIILLILFADNRYKTYRNLFEQKLFTSLLFVNALLLVTGCAKILIQGKTGELARGVNYALTDMSYIITPLLFIIMASYIKYQVFRDKNKAKNIILMPFMIPFYLNILMIVINRYYSIYYYIDKNNYFHRGEFLFLYFMFYMSYILYSEIIIISNKKKIIKKHYIPLFFFELPSLIIGILQCILKNFDYISLSITLSVLIIFIDIQNDQLYTDELTGLYNRRQLYCYLNKMIKRCDKENTLAGVMIDLNFFKNVNDTWGHSVGDQMLIDTGEILKTSFEKSDLVCRYGGDEFVVIFKIKNESDLLESINRIKTNINIYQQKSNTPYIINLSMGYDIYDYGSGHTVQQFINHIDYLMYKNKKHTKKLKLQNKL